MWSLEVLQLLLGIIPPRISGHNQSGPSGSFQPPWMKYSNSIHRAFYGKPTSILRLVQQVGLAQEGLESTQCYRNTYPWVLNSHRNTSGASIWPSYVEPSISQNWHRVAFDRAVFGLLSQDHFSRSPLAHLSADLERRHLQRVSDGLGKRQIPLSMDEFSDYYYYYFCLLPVKTRGKPWSHGNQWKNSYWFHQGEGFLSGFPDVLYSKLANFIPLDLCSIIYTIEWDLPYCIS